MQVYFNVIRTMKTVVRFFRQKAINGFLKHKKPCVLPDISKYPSMAILLDQNQFKRYKDIETELRRLFLLRSYTFIVYVDVLPKDVLQTDRYFFIRRGDFNLCGLMKQAKKESLQRLKFNLVVDFTGTSDEQLTNEYIMTLINNSFRMTFGNTCPALYDMVIDSKKDDDMFNRMEILKNYLSMLLGQK